MKAVILLSKGFFPNHPKAGQPTNFRNKALKGSKKHTCRKNYGYWKDKIDRLQEKGGVLSLREWIGQPFKQPGQEVIIDIPAEVVGVQKLELTRRGNDWTAKVDGYNTPVALVAENDGLTEEEFKAWFAPVFDEAEKKYPELAQNSNATIIDFAIIHFTKERY